jgi:predicted AlkP superfamily phosphohydrolase/phosphomutase
MIMFRATDVIQHCFWDQHHLLDEGYRLVDRCIGEILTAFPDVTTFLISDHGLQAQRRDFHINKWLIDMRYMSIKRGRKTDLSRWQQISELDGRRELAQTQLTTSNTSRLLLRLGVTGHNLRRLVPRAWRRSVKNSLPRSIKDRIPASEDIIYDVDWDRTQASAYQLYATESKAIKIISPAGRSREGLCDELVDRLEALRDPETGAHVVRRAHRRENLYSGPYVERAPDIILDLHDGYNITNAFFADDYVTPRDELRGCHHREGILIASGQDIERGKSLASLPSLLDVMPTALHYLEAAVPADCDGRVLAEIFEPHSETATRPIRHERISEGQTLDVEVEVHGDEGEAEIEERLRALGYL